MDPVELSEGWRCQKCPRRVRQATRVRLRCEDDVAGRARRHVDDVEGFGLRIADDLGETRQVVDVPDRVDYRGGGSLSVEPAG